MPAAGSIKDGAETNGGFRFAERSCRGLVQNTERDAAAHWRSRDKASCGEEERPDFGLKRMKCSLLLKYLTGMGSPKTALGLMTPVA